MKAKEYLLQLENMDIKIKHKQEEINALKELAEATGATSDGERVQTSMNGDKLPMVVARYIDLEKEAEEEMDRYIILRQRIIDEIHSLNKKLYMDILFKRYVEFKKLELIAAETGYSYQHIRNQHGYALLDFNKKIVQKSTK